MTAMSGHEDDVAEIYAKFGRLERKVDHLRMEVGRRFDRIEARLTTELAELASRDPAADEHLDRDLTVMGEHLARIDHHLARLDGVLDGTGKHLARIDARLERMDSVFSEVLGSIAGRG